MAAEIERARPEWVVVSETGNSWLETRDSHRWIREWVNQYFSERYQLIGLGRVVPEIGVRMEWAGQQEPWREIPAHTLLVLRRVEPAVR